METAQMTAGRNYIYKDANFWEYHQLRLGTYSYFTIPGEKRRTVILKNKEI